MTAAAKAIEAGHAFVSFAHKDQLGAAVTLCQSFAVDNGAFSAWKNGRPVKKWDEFYGWAEKCRRIPSCDFAVIPDVIDGDEADNDALIKDCPLPAWFSAPVWHMHESLRRLDRLAAQYHRVCIGSSGQYSTVGTVDWQRRMREALDVICDDDGFPAVKLHGLRMLNPKVFTKFPFASADSTNIGRNVGIDKHWAKGHYLPPTKETRAQVMRQRIEAHNAPATFNFGDEL
jgi:hypothetical protein